MFLTKTRYNIVSCVQYCLLLVDMFINAFGGNLRYSNGMVLMIYIIQDSLQILGLTILLVGLFQTNVFQAGFVELLYDRFRMTVFFSTVYLLVTIGLQAWLLTARWDNPYKLNWPNSLPFMYIIHRFMSCVHYYYYKRSVLRLSDPRFYDDAWITQRLYRGDGILR